MARLMIVTGIRLYREGLTRLLDAVSEIEVVATADSRDQALERLREFSPDTVLVDRAIAGSLALISSIRSASRDIKVVALILEEAEGEVIPVAEAGVHGYVTHDASAKELVQTIHASRAGELRCSPRTARHLLRRVSHLATRRHPLSALTTREVEVLAFVERGMSNRNISRSLGIEVATVKNHVHNILEKLQVRRRGEAAALYRSGSAPA